MQTASVEPRGCIHCHIPIAHRKMNHNIVAAEHLIYTCQRNSLLPACCAGGKETHRLVINIYIVIKYRILLGGALYKTWISATHTITRLNCRSRARRCIWVAILCYADKILWLKLRHSYPLHSIISLCIIKEKDLWLIVIYALRYLSRA